MCSLRSICAYFDTQGYYINGNYHPVEVSMFGKGQIIHLNLEKTCSCEFSKEEVHSIMRNDHGLKPRKRGINDDKMANIIKFFYKSFRSFPADMVGVISKESEMILKSLKIPTVNLGDKYDASFSTIRSGRRPCYLHARKGASIKCSLNIVQDLYHYIDKIIRNQNQTV
uniref:Uncharacterized protein n=1 Tax=Tetranychus urticae TaxID=32264 RepID=A0A158P4E8_TETUR